MPISESAFNNNYDSVKNVRWSYFGKGGGGNRANGNLFQILWERNPDNNNKVITVGSSLTLSRVVVCLWNYLILIPKYHIIGTRILVKYFLFNISVTCEIQPVPLIYFNILKTKLLVPERLKSTNEIKAYLKEKWLQSLFITS